jgi:hypothetical protein
VARENVLNFNRGAGPETAMIRHGDTEYGGGRGAAAFVMVRGADGKTEYLHSGLRSYAPEPSRAGCAAARGIEE